MARPTEEQEDFFAGEEPDMGKILRGLGPPSFNDSFIERRNRLYAKRSRMMDRIIETQQEILAIERILGG